MFKEVKTKLIRTICKLQFVAPRMYMSRVWQPLQTNWAISVPVTHTLVFLIYLPHDHLIQITQLSNSNNRVSEEKLHHTRRWNCCDCIANSTTHRGCLNWIHEKVSTSRTHKLTLSTYQSRK